MATAAETDWGAVARGFVPSLPEPRGNTSSATIATSGLAAAVGINMVFLYPYSLRARGWGGAGAGGAPVAGSGYPVVPPGVLPGAVTGVVWARRVSVEPTASNATTMTTPRSHSRRGRTTEGAGEQAFRIGSSLNVDSDPDRAT